MSPSTQLSRRVRWAVPLGALAITGGVIAASLVSSAQATPTLPSRTPAQLLAAVAGRTGPLPPITGTVVETAALGLPDLPGPGDSTSLQSLITGSHTIRVWYSDPQHIRLAIPGQLSETDLIRAGQDVWMWSSYQNTATRLKLSATTGDTPAPAQLPLTPQQAAKQVLAAVGPTTSVTVASNVMVAGEASYELVLAPKDSRSLVGQVRIAVDARRNVPLRVQAFARGAATPAFQTGFTSIAFTRPAAANFAFTPPAGAKVVQQSPPAGHAHTATGNAAKANAAKTGAAKTGADSTVVGQGWLAVAVMPMASAQSNRPNGRSDSPSRGGGGSTRRELNALTGAAAPVNGSWGNGRLLRTKLVSVLVTSDGRLLIGAVTPDVLYSAAAKTSQLAGQVGR
jgi:outer membrane lipoprotein-sorting protein